MTPTQPNPAGVRTDGVVLQSPSPLARLGRRDFGLIGALLLVLALVIAFGWLTEEVMEMGHRRVRPGR